VNAWKIRGWISPRSYWLLAGAGLAAPLAAWALLVASGADRKSVV
jgi:hypothetical protein